MDQTGELIAGLADDLDGHFESMVLLYQDQLYRFALRMSGNPEDAEEVVQDALVRAYRALSRYPTERILTLALRPWLYQICLNAFRNRVRRRTLQLVPLNGDLPEHSDQERPERLVEASEGSRELATRLAALPNRFRAAVVLRHIEELGIAEIAAVLGQPEGTVKSNIHRGIRLLRQEMERSEVLQ
ncbi:MAG: sigma-70 family RNA polymerase sigma factor [Chloroflexota bacterium]|nr:sigma-70 family RNA polymerase sigma factor [Chloroflexota bacterium]